MNTFKRLRQLSTQVKCLILKKYFQIRHNKFGQHDCVDQIIKIWEEIINTSWIHDSFSFFSNIIYFTLSDTIVSSLNIIFLSVVWVVMIIHKNDTSIWFSYINSPWYWNHLAQTRQIGPTYLNSSNIPLIQRNKKLFHISDSFGCNYCQSFKGK